MSTNAPDGTEIHFTDHDPHGPGSGGVVFVHGITESSRAWDPIVERLAPARRVVTLDLRGHGESATSDRYDLEAMASDVASVVAAAGLDAPHLVGHSLGGAVVSAAGAILPVASVVNVDQSLRLDGFKAQLMPVADQLRDPATFATVIEGLFDLLAGDRLGDAERERLVALRRPDRDVVLGVWELVLSHPAEDITAIVDGALAAYAGRTVPYLALFGIDPGADYGDWLSSRIDGAVTEVWDGDGHYPHLVDPDRFVERLRTFWTT